MPKLKSNKQGFTLVETVFAVSFVLVGVVVSFGLLKSSFLFSQDSANRLVSLGLAKEAMEAVRNIRDSNFRQNITWNEDYMNTWGASLADEGFFVVDFLEGKSTSWKLEKIASLSTAREEVIENSKTDIFLKEEISRKTFTHAELNNKKTRYKRFLEIKKDSADKMEVRAFVFWGEKEYQSIYLKTILTNWHEI